MTSPLLQKQDQLPNTSAFKKIEKPQFPNDKMDPTVVPIPNPRSQQNFNSFHQGMGRSLIHL